VTEGRARTVFIGSGGFGRESLWRLDQHPDVELVGVVTAPPRPAGRGGRETVTPIHDAARYVDVRPILTPARLRDPASLDEITRLGPDLVVLADYGQIVPSPLLDVRHGALNLHPSLLPRYRGATPIPAAILAGDAETGVTLMRMDSGLDTGPIVAQSRVRLEGDETTPLLEETLEVEAAGLLRRDDRRAGRDLASGGRAGWPCARHLRRGAPGRERRRAPVARGPARRRDAHVVGCLRAGPADDRRQ
jgi:methionyl-tRNA formyltransferase